MNSSQIFWALLEDEKLRRKVGEKLRKEVEREYTWSRAAERVEEVYEGLISSDF